MQSITKNSKKRLKKVFRILYLSILAINLSCSSETVIDELPEDILVESLSIVGDNISDGKSSQLRVNIFPNNATKKSVTWSVLDTSVAQISESGLLTAGSNGDVIVKVEAKD